MSSLAISDGSDAPMRLDRYDTWLREPHLVMAPERLGAARPTRHSFAASLLRTAVRQRWRIAIERWAIDGAGVGEAVYRVDTPTDVLRFVVFATVIDDGDRTDRVVAKSWDVTAALVDGTLNEDRLRQMRREVPRQERGRADSAALIWTRGNRSSRFFDHVVAALAAGSQPDPALIGCSPYLIRSTAYYSNGKFGMATYPGVRRRPAVAAPYRAHMLAGWLFREFSCDLVEHMARHRSARAVTLSGSWRRALGIGNATGLGMVPYVINHPAILDRWVSVREIALAAARSRDAAGARRGWPRLLARLSHVAGWCEARADRSCSPFQDPGSLAAEIRHIRTLAGEEPTGRHPLDRVWRMAVDHAGIEAQEIVASVLTDLDESLDDALESLLHVDEEPHDPRSSDTVGQLLGELDQYSWVHGLAERDGADHWFWYYARDNEEPRRGVRGVDRGVDVEMPIDVSTAVHAMSGDLGTCAPDEAVASFLVRHPEHRAAVARVQHHARLRYAEVRDNLLGTEFLPLQLQRFQLAMYGAADFVPQSTDWVRVTLLNGAPSRHTLALPHRYEYQLFPPLPNRTEE